ncbi:hypothetical protein FXO38_13843 [Capsicum annuum]|uniref:Ubiquitin-like protease family profile domain-containing protein n=1 Tax=Capsicum annuum TaxID=4072 RepID=A0A2G2YKA3_CAPAN|nr:hypothetical protein FXO37_32905 [Capsicum annuum]KAF3657110.1 hypothetical protein FXO38_13843 [Capsicum annuum]PHT70125.1 hypothetical protein T459_25229 [Capsicum annuum]
MAILSKSITWVPRKKDLEKNVGAEDLLPFPLEEEFSKSSLYSQLQEFGGINVDTKDMVSYVDGTKKVVNVDLTTCDVEISHLDSIFYYMRKKAKYEPNIVVNFTTTDLVFRNKIDALYQNFVENGKDFYTIPKKHEVEEYIRGFYYDANILWNKVNFYLEKGIDKSENNTLLIKMIDELPQQTQCDCGAFVCAFAEYVIHGRNIPKEIDIGYVRMRYGALLWDYGKRKLQADSVLEGYLAVYLFPSRTLVSEGFVIRSFMLSGTIHDVVLQLVGFLLGMFVAKIVLRTNKNNS